MGAGFRNINVKDKMTESSLHRAMIVISAFSLLLVLLLSASKEFIYFGKRNRRNGIFSVTFVNMNTMKFKSMRWLMLSYCYGNAGIWNISIESV